MEGLSSKERFQNGVVIKSSERALVLFSESKFNIMSAGYLQKAYLTQSYGVDENLIGSLTLYRPSGSNGVSFVPIVLEKINVGFSHIMAAAQRSTRYETENLPAQTREYFNTVGVPEYRF